MSVRILIGDVREKLAELPDESVHCVVTSPPYFGLRSYLPDGHDDKLMEIGLEPTPDAFVAVMVDVFREVRRVLRGDGTVWLNLGDSYTGSANNGGVTSKTMEGTQAATGNNLPIKRGNGLKPKDLIGIPWRVAFALQADGWYLRQDIIWHKPNPMPESVTDRCTKSHEYIFLLSKRARYYYDATAIAEVAIYAGDVKDYTGDQKNNMADPVRQRTLPRGKTITVGETRNKRSVWTVATQPFMGAHFATFPPALIEPCILAGCPKGGTVLDCFGGPGTTGLVADRHGRDAILIELNPDTAEMARKRITDDSPMFVDIAEPAPKPVQGALI